MGVLHMPTAAGHHPLKSCPRHEATPQIILKSVTFTMTTDSPSRAPPRMETRTGNSGMQRLQLSVHTQYTHGTHMYTPMYNPCTHAIH